MKKEELKIFAMAKVCMDTYKSRYDKAKAKKEERFKKLNRNFVPGSPMFVAERDKITPEYQAEVEGAKSHKERIGIIYDNLNNRHFVKTLEKYIADTSDKALKESYENMQEVKREQESETK